MQVIITQWQIGTPIPPEVNVSPDAGVLLFTIAITVLVSIASGLVPAIQSTRLNFTPALKGETGARARPILASPASWWSRKSHCRWYC
jgi:hypothetical protein